MEMLHVVKGAIVDRRGATVRLRGTCVGGWMNMENFINGYTGAEHGLRSAMADELGEPRTSFFFDRLLDYLLAEDDFRFISECGANAVRLPVNYRHFESDDRPFLYREGGFERLGKAISLCEKYGLYAIIDMHSAQGWQNNDWHCDNSIRQSHLWDSFHFQERFVALWEEIARRYRDNAAVAGYNILNEPYCNRPLGDFTPRSAYRPDWDRINALYRRTVGSIRAIDPEHIIFLEGDCYSTLFKGLEAPFSNNLVYSSHNYAGSGFGPGAYPGVFWGQYHDRKSLGTMFGDSQGVQYTRKYNVPLWVGEFGSVFNGPPDETADRLASIDDQIDVFEEAGAHWTTWTYKDVGVMGWVTLDPECEYLQVIAPVVKAKTELRTDLWMGWLPQTPMNKMMNEMTAYIETVVGEPETKAADFGQYFMQSTASGFIGALLQPAYARRFRGMSENDIDRVLQSFAFGNCRVNGGLVGIIKKHTARPPE